MATFFDESVNPAELVDIALEAARAGAAVLREGAHQVLQVDVKGEQGNLVTNVDVAAEVAVRDVILRRRPDDEITGEELPVNEAAGAQVRWSIDPLDGTTNFTRGIPYYATSVGAVAASGAWLAGAVVAPALSKTYYGYLGGGAWISDPQGVRRLVGPVDRSGALLLGMGYSYSSDIRRAQYAQTAEMMADYTDARALGSAALAVCAVAEGALDGYVETDLAEYDWAAAALIAEEAGLLVVRPTANSTALRIEAAHIRKV
jgi:myo-inositol-1(or 4)-monophosphatase